MAQKPIILIYNNNAGPTGPTGGNPNQNLAGVAAVSLYAIAPGVAPQAPIPGNTDAAAVIQSNGELIGNAQLPYNPLPLGLNK